MKKIILLVGKEPIKQIVSMDDDVNVEGLAKQFNFEVHESDDEVTIKLLEKIISDKIKSIVKCEYENAAFFRNQEQDFILKLFGISNTFNQSAFSETDETLIYVYYNRT